MFYEKQIFKEILTPLKVRKSRSPISLNMTKTTSSDSPFFFNQDGASTVEGDSASVSRARRFLFHILGLLRQVGSFLFHCMGMFEKARWFFFHKYLSRQNILTDRGFILLLVAVQCRPMFMISRLIGAHIIS